MYKYIITRKIDSAGRIIIPEKTLAELGLSKGDYLDLYVDDKTQNIVIERAVHRVRENKVKHNE